MEQDANRKADPVQDVAGDAETEIRKLINRHIQNKDDVISEEEFRNLKVGVSAPLEEIAEQTTQLQNNNINENETPEKTRRRP